MFGMGLVGRTDGPESDNNPGIAGAWVNLCGTEWAEWVGDVYYADEDLSVPSPLAFQVFMSGKDATVTLSVTHPPSVTLP